MTPEPRLPDAARLAEVVAWLGATPGGSVYAVTVRELATGLAERAVLAERVRTLEGCLWRAFLMGFGESSEGFNAEYGGPPEDELRSVFDEWLAGLGADPATQETSQND